MHTNIHYTGTEEDKRAKAIEDVKNWVGTKKFNEVSKAVKECQPPMNRAQFLFMCQIGGIQGYPVEAWADSINVPPYTEEEQKVLFKE